MGRAIGETMAVIMVAGNALQIPTSPLDPVRTLTSNIAWSGLRRRPPPGGPVRHRHRALHHYHDLNLSATLITRGGSKTVFSFR